MGSTIAAMDTTALVIAIMAIALAAYLVYLAKTIRGDGYGLSLSHRQPPRSHPTDRFGPNYG